MLVNSQKYAVLTVTAMFKAIKILDVFSPEMLMENIKDSAQVLLLELKPYSYGKMILLVNYLPLP